MRPSRPIAEALTFAAGVILYLWVLRSRAPWTIWLLALAVAISFWRHSETIASVGLAPRALQAAVSAWSPWLVLTAIGTVAAGGLRVLSAEALCRALIYFLWCTAQQVVYQTMVYRRLREAFSPSWRAWILSGILFSAAHAPNPVLAPGTLAWGITSSWLFERRPSAPALGLLQFFLSTLLLLLTPLRWHRNFRVGPGYLQFRP